jgi:hypothetical protein
MALVLADRVRETTTTTGTGSVTLGGAYTGFQTFLAGVANNNSTYYTIANVTTGEYEVGIGTYTTAGNLLSRTTVLTSSNSNALVNFAAGSKDVFVTQPAGRAVYIDSAGTTVDVNILAASGDSSFNSTGALKISAGTTGQRPTGAVGKIRWNSTLSQYEGYDGANWTLLGGAVISNDTATATNLYPVFSSVTTGNASTLYTGNAKLLYKPSTGELQASVPVALNGLVVNSQTVSASYTIAVGYSAMSAGPVAVASGQAVTVSSGSRWVIV